MNRKTKIVVIAHEDRSIYRDLLWVDVENIERVEMDLQSQSSFRKGQECIKSR